MPIKQAKCKICRRLGRKLMLKGDRCLSSKCAMVKRKYPPGIHGAKKTRLKITEYGLQLREKQKAREIYGILEKSFKKYYEKAIKTKGNVNKNLIDFLEMRLDNVIYRANIAKSRNQAKQLVGHGNFIVNKYKTDIPSYHVKINDVIKLREIKKGNNFFKNVIIELKNKKNQEIPSWIAFNKEKMEIKILSKPSIEEIEQSFDSKMIIEYYSR
ncbi:MAG: 30S ribosomal protein S4 [Xanthomonadaceae bacterium]|nr:30S ribosomal protein S4 [Rhodospirillaceae bacterium]NIA17928.1 30S ribosomal protein S4 [Xanthomonadaceae bacterium]